MDGATLAAWVAAVAAIAAAFLAGWSAISSHRSARSAAAAVDLERDRQHRELTPRIDLEHDGPLGGDDEGVWFSNRGPLDYDALSFTLTQDDAHRPIAGFLIDDDCVTSGALGPLPIGERRFLHYRRPAPDEGAGTLHLRLTCQSEERAWTMPGEVEIPGVPHIFAAWA